MNLQRLIFWKAQQAHSAETVCGSPAASDVVAPAPPQTQVAESNVVSLPPRTPLDVPAGLDAHLAEAPPPVAVRSPQPRGLLDAPELKEFFADNHFGLGRHNGCNFRTQEALQHGKQALVSTFQNRVAELVEQKQAKVDRLNDKLLETDGFCDITTGRLRQAIANLEREMALLRAQIDSASDGKGWVLEALNRYQIGFGKGLREAIEFELLAD